MMADFEEMAAAVTRATRRRAPRPKRRNLPVEPLLKLWEGRGLNIDEIAMHCGVTRSTINGWERNGLGLRAADKVAIHLGRHPLHIWGNDYWNA